MCERARPGGWRRTAAAWVLALVGAACAAGPPQGAEPGRSASALEPFRIGLTAAFQELPPELLQATVYRLDLRVEDGLGEIQGSLKVQYCNRLERNLESVRFFLFPNLFPGVLSLRGASAGGFAVDPAFPLGPHLAVLDLPEPLAPGQWVELGLEYTLRPPDGGEAAYEAFARSQDVLSLACACPVIPAASTWTQRPPVPVGDFLAAEAAFFLARVWLPAGWELAAPGVVRERRAEDARTEWSVAHGPARDLYLAALQGYTRHDIRQAEVTVSSWAPAGAEAGAGLAAETAAAALRYFQARFGPYPYTRLVLVSAPFTSYGLEFPGITLLASRLYDLAGRERGQPNRVLLESTVAHETAHQWFYALLGNDPQSEPWLDEAPAQYATWLYYRDRYGEGAAAAFFATFESRWERVRRQEIPIGLPVRAYTPEQYAAIVYGRAPLFLKALADRLGEPAFDRLLAGYLRRFQWRLATSSDFLGLAAEACGCPPQELAAEWGVLP